MSLRQEVIDGLKALYLLNLPHTPAADKMREVGEVWLAVIEAQFLSWIPEDEGRIHQGFLRLMAHIDRWPCPKQLLEALPPRKETQQKIERPKATEEEKAAYRAMLKELMAKVKWR